MKKGQKVYVIRSYGVDGKPNLKSGKLGDLADSHKVGGRYVQAYFVDFDDGTFAVVQPKDIRMVKTSRKRSNPRPQPLRYADLSAREQQVYRALAPAARSRYLESLEAERAEERRGSREARWNPGKAKPRSRSRHNPSAAEHYARYAELYRQGRHDEAKVEWEAHLAAGREEVKAHPEKHTATILWTGRGPTWGWRISRSPSGLVTFMYTGSSAPRGSRVQTWKGYTSFEGIRAPKEVREAFERFSGNNPGRRS